MKQTPQQPPDGPRQPVPVKLLLPRWLTRGAIIYVVVCFAMLIPLGVIAVYESIQAGKVYPPEERRRAEERRQAVLEETRRFNEAHRHPSSSPSPLKKISQ